jgi:hypothetical protein
MAANEQPEERKLILGGNAAEPAEEESDTMTINPERILIERAAYQAADVRYLVYQTPRMTFLRLVKDELIRRAVSVNVGDGMFYRISAWHLFNSPESRDAIADLYGQATLDQITAQALEQLLATRKLAGPSVNFPGAPKPEAEGASGEQPEKLNLKDEELKKQTFSIFDGHDRLINKGHHLNEDDILVDDEGVNRHFLLLHWPLKPLAEHDSDQRTIFYNAVKLGVLKLAEKMPRTNNRGLPLNLVLEEFSTLAKVPMAEQVGPDGKPKEEEHYFLYLRLLTVDEALRLKLPIVRLEEAAAGRMENFVKQSKRLAELEKAAKSTSAIEEKKEEKSEPKE